MIESYLGIWRQLLRVIYESSVAYWGYLGICAGYLGLFVIVIVIWGFGVDYLGLFFPLPGIFWGIMMTITDLVTPPATRAVAPNRLLLSSRALPLSPDPFEF